MDLVKHFSHTTAHIYSDADESQDPTGLEDWDYNYKLERGRLISKPVYSSKSSPSSSPRLSKKIPTKHFPKSNRQYSFSPTVINIAMRKKESRRGLWYDPDPPSQIVDGKTDKDFLNSLQPSEPTTLETFDSHPISSTTGEHEFRLKCWRAQTARLFQTQSPETFKLRDKSNMSSKEIPTIEQVLLRVQEERQSHDDSSIVASIVSAGDGSEMKKEMSIGEYRDTENVKLSSSQCDEQFVFPRQTMALSGVFSRRMSADQFEGEIIIEESSEVMKMLGAWMARDLDFEITIENCEHLLSLATRYEIPRLEKDVIPQLFSLSLDPFHAYTYGKIYSIPALARQHEPHVLIYFTDYVEAYFHKLAVACPDGATDLVRQYVKSVSSPKGKPKETSAPSKKFIDWLEASDPI